MYWSGFFGKHKDEGDYAPLFKRIVIRSQCELLTTDFGFLRQDEGKCLEASFCGKAEEKQSLA